jgi:hypothetical protein
MEFMTLIANKLASVSSNFSNISNLSTGRFK